MYGGGICMKKIIRIVFILFICIVLIGGVFIGKVRAKELPEGFKKNSKFSAEEYSMKPDYSQRISATPNKEIIAYESMII